METRTRKEFIFTDDEFMKKLGINSNNAVKKYRIITVVDYPTEVKVVCADCGK
jgi:hypothetical protein